MGEGLERFVRAQDEGGTYERALSELHAGAKRSHWMWFVFPQIAGLGRSEMARHFAIRDFGEARAYLDHPLLGPRLRACTTAMLDWAGQREAEAILGGVDAQKFRSALTLFERADANPESTFAAALEAFFGGKRDPLTLARLDGQT